MMTSPPVPNPSTNVHTLCWKPCLWQAVKGLSWSALSAYSQLEVTVLLAANVDLLTLNPALTSHGIYLTERKKEKHTAVQHGQFG